MRGESKQLEETLSKKPFLYHGFLKYEFKRRQDRATKQQEVYHQINAMFIRVSRRSGNANFKQVGRIFKKGVYVGKIDFVELELEKVVEQKYFAIVFEWY